MFSLKVDGVGTSARIMTLALGDPAHSLVNLGNLWYIRRRLDSLAFIAPGPVEYFTSMAHIWLKWADIIRWRECSKKFVQQGRSHFDARSVLSVREHGKMATVPVQSQGTPLAAFFNIPRKESEELWQDAYS